MNCSLTINVNFSIDLDLLFLLLDCLEFARQQKEYRELTQKEHRDPALEQRRLATLNIVLQNLQSRVNALMDSSMRPAKGATGKCRDSATSMATS